MKTKPVLYTLGAFLFILGLTMLVPLACSLFYGEADSPQLRRLHSDHLRNRPGACTSSGRPKGGKTLLGHREGFLIVSAGWILASFFGGLPYMIHGALPALTDAYFETMSGFTTTGATVINKIEAPPPRDPPLAIDDPVAGRDGDHHPVGRHPPLPRGGGRQLFKAEVPGPIKDKLEPRIAETARSLWIVYVIITIAGFIFLLFGGMSVFDAVNHIFCAMATGGFSTKDSSIAWFNSAYIDGVLVAFMIIAGMNFTLHYQLLTGEFPDLLQGQRGPFLSGHDPHRHAPDHAGPPAERDGGPRAGPSATRSSRSPRSSRRPDSSRTTSPSGRPFPRSSSCF